jgi:hypothetical protein
MNPDERAAVRAARDAHARAVVAEQERQRLEAAEWAEDHAEALRRSHHMRLARAALPARIDGATNGP